MKRMARRLHRRDERGWASIVAVFSLLILIMLCQLVAGLMATGSEEARALLRAKQAFYLSDTGNNIAKQLIVDNGTTWRPWNGASYNCPTNWTGAANDGDTHYCQGTMTVGGLTGTIRVYVCTKNTTTGDSSNPCTDAPAGSGDIDVLGYGFVTGA
jgi:hypothetical protein